MVISMILLLLLLLLLVLVLLSWLVTSSDVLAALGDASAASFRPRPCWVARGCGCGSEKKRKAVVANGKICMMLPDMIASFGI